MEAASTPASYNLNSGLSQQYPDYVCHIAAEESGIGRGRLPRDYYGKLWFDILDYTGIATRNESTREDWGGGNWRKTL